MRRIVLYNTLLIAVLLFISCHQILTPVQVQSQNFSVDEKLSGIDSQLVKNYLPYKELLEKDMSKVISVSENEMVKDRPESQMTNFMADLLLEEGKEYCIKTNLEFKPDFSYVNYGGIRTFLPKGEITVGKVFELMPFENELVFLNLKGDIVQSFLDILADKGGDAVGGIRFKISNGKAKNIEIGGIPFNPEKNYWLVTNDYIAGGGDDLGILLKRNELINSGELIREIIIDYMLKRQQEGKSLVSKKDGRISYE